MYSRRVLCYHDPQGVLDHAALAFIVADERREHRQPGGVRRGPAGGSERVGDEVQLRAVRRAPAVRGQLYKPCFPDRACRQRDDYGMAIVNTESILPQP